MPILDDCSVTTKRIVDWIRKNYRAYITINYYPYCIEISFRHGSIEITQYDSMRPRCHISYLGLEGYTDSESVNVFALNVKPILDNVKDIKEYVS